MITFYNWTVESPQVHSSIEILLCFLLPEYSRMFGPELMNAERCIVYNDPSADCPMLIINTDPIRIRLNQKSTTYWAQTVYQLSHEMCHYAIRQGKEDKDFTLKWMEETICEAVSLYALEYAARNWNQCLLSKINAQFSDSLIDYLEALLKTMPQDDLRRCKSLYDLYLCNIGAEKKRDGRIQERNTLYREISKNPYECCCFCDMYRYLNDDKLTINFENWLDDDQSVIVHCLKSIQPKIIKYSDY